MKEYVTAEACRLGHPDKLADLISDSILDEILRKDKNSRVACDCVVARGFVFVFGQITSKAKVDYKRIVRKTLKNAGYGSKASGFDLSKARLWIKIDEQAEEIAKGVVEAKGAGDQGIMIGYATNETKEFMPLSFVLARKLVNRIETVKKKKIIPSLLSDGKTQVTLEYDEGKAKRIEAIVVSVQHRKGVKEGAFRQKIFKEVILKALPKDMIDDNTKVFVNPTGSFVAGGPSADSGLTGKKTIVDSYGPQARSGGGCLSGKDPTKVDRSASCYARYVAKNLVAAGLCGKAEVELAYVIGIPEPVAVRLDFFGTEKKDKLLLYEAVLSSFDFTVQGMIRDLKLLKPGYAKTVKGHYGRKGFSWEKTDKIAKLKASVKRLEKRKARKKR